ncbi:hypothetical protein C5167_019053 [Papaver somniferum]|uniref:RIN4 pathogenic type III effector avirulence factor Avr cleavage site domain-containing protein n=1 Tax=Papaver somniferum TaxID=3469 RepID=A0A4Y7IP07_PAPSO|nr:RPM1-interacting protein 4-like isoform X1 [Papaver somniferum]RZC50624.1 hypothetical protein C5167_019053 [Papaver somniferum]
MAQQGSHVPKFGDWDSDNIPYTAYFETARTEKGSVAKRINPNDPEENPYAFFGTMGHENHGYYNAKKLARNSSGRKTVEKSYEEYPEKEGQQVHLKSRDQKSIRSESSNEKSNSDFSLLQQKHRSSRSIEKRSQGEFSGIPPMSPPPNQIRSGTSIPNDTRHHKAASVPKFGAWDETDPKSGDGFTIIFNKVKEEKQILANNFPPICPPPTNYSKESSSKAPRRCCCLF